VRALLNGERQGGVGVVLGLVGVICLLIASIGLNIKQSRDLSAVKHTLQQRCALRQQSDARERADLQVRIDLYAGLLRVEQASAALYREAMDKAQATLDGMPAPVDCRQVYSLPRAVAR
jgi:hypothetical protein